MNFFRPSLSFSSLSFPSLTISSLNFSFSLLNVIEVRSTVGLVADVTTLLIPLLFS